MDLRTKVCFELSRRMMRSPPPRTVDYGAYDSWRVESLSKSWRDAFPDAYATGQDVLDFGCGDGQLSYFLAGHKHARQVCGADINPAAIERARKNLPAGLNCRFEVGQVDRIPFDEESFDTIVAFDCLEHVMNMPSVLSEWRRILKRNGRCAVEWFPYKGPWGPHMESLIPIPWAHVVFGQKAMFRAAEAIYDLPEFTPRHWDLDEQGDKKPNKWRAWKSFREQGYINELEVPEFQRMVDDAGLVITRLERHSFGGSPARRSVGSAFMNLPLVGDYFCMYVLVELMRKEDRPAKSR